VRCHRNRQYHRYADDSSGNEISATAVGKLNIGNIWGSLALVKHDDGGSRGLFAPDRPTTIDPSEDQG